VSHHEGQPKHSLDIKNGRVWSLDPGRLLCTLDEVHSHISMSSEGFLVLTLLRDAAVIREVVFEGPSKNAHCALLQYLMLHSTWTADEQIISDCLGYQSPIFNWF